MCRKDSFEMCKNNTFHSFQICRTNSFETSRRNSLEKCKQLFSLRRNNSEQSFCDGKEGVNNKVEVCYPNDNKETHELPLNDTICDSKESSELMPYLYSIHPSPRLSTILIILGFITLSLKITLCNTAITGILFLYHKIDPKPVNDYIPVSR